MNRRNFVKHLLSSTMGLGSASAALSSMSLVNSALAQTSRRFDDYKALVCIFLHGGNDSFNMLIPNEANDYQNYQKVRQNLAIAQSDLMPISPISSMPYNLALPSFMSPMRQLFSQGNLAFLANTGPLLQPVNKSQAQQNADLLPPQLFSHNDQQKHWQTSWPEQTSRSGWAGRMADLIMDSTNPLSMNLSIAGANILQTGASSLPYSLDASGVETFAALDPNKNWNKDRLEVFTKLMAAETHPLGQAHNAIYTRAQSNIDSVANAINSASEPVVSYPDNHLANQLKMVATLASTQQLLSQPRQIFFVSMGGFDTHDNQNSMQPVLLQTLSEALFAFNADLQARGLANNITSFTMSDFGRTLTSNGDGTDHGWGGHQIIMGGAVQGGDIYGNMPEDFSLNSADDFGDGRIIPTTSVDQYAATLAKWFGLSTNEIDAVFPNLSRFNRRDLGFMRPS
ncbi:DUF1501 domain-containing protein [Colwellia sp. KU-HH00111]|uniref:DUF1501 domain-containing protein n=1 Tax=Colwellia sp. KU-HH00111 TaxID=3127652 RepID=UPI003108DFA7